MRALITGATGYIGSHLVVTLLKAGWEVHALTRASSTGAPDARIKRHALDESALQSSISAAFDAALPDTVFHLASHITPLYGMDLSPQVIADNVLFGVCLLEAACAHSVRRFINTGSYWEYGNSGDYQPNTLYAASKRAFQDILHWYACHRGMEAATLVLFDVYGPRDARGKLLPDLLAHYRGEKGNGQPMALTEGRQLLDMVHVDDVAAAFLHAANSLSPCCPPPTWAVATGQRIDLRTLIFMLDAAFGHHLPVAWGAKPYPPHQIMNPVSTLASLPGWMPAYNLEKGLADILSAV